mgnify:CR=1 FL=1
MSQRTEHTGSYYADSRNDKQDRPCLSGEIDTQICIIGAGFTGISSALHLAEAGFKVVVLVASLMMPAQIPLLRQKQRQAIAHLVQTRVVTITQTFQIRLRTTWITRTERAKTCLR